jgi:integrase/recombinase XerC
LEDLIQHYADHLRHERNVSPHTLRNYLSDLAQFQQFLIERELALGAGGKVDARKVDVHVVRAFLAALTQDRKKSSIGRKLAALKGFFRYLLTTHKIAKNPLLTMHSPKQEKPLPAFLSVDDVFQLLGASRSRLRSTPVTAPPGSFLFIRPARERAGRARLGRHRFSTGHIARRRQGFEGADRPGR